MKGLLMLFVLLGAQPCQFTAGISPSSNGTGINRAAFIDPTGTYILKGATEKNKVIGHSGEIRIKLLDRDRVAMCFYINKGYPGYESGSFLDTLSYDDDNKAVYTPAADSGCAFLFYFAPNSAETVQLFNDPQSGCGFGKDVMASARFEKYSGEMPVIQDLSARGVAQ